MNKTKKTEKKSIARGSKKAPRVRKPKHGVVRRAALTVVRGAQNIAGYVAMAAWTPYVLVRFAEAALVDGDFTLAVNG